MAVPSPKVSSPESLHPGSPVLSIGIIPKYARPLSGAAVQDDYLSLTGSSNRNTNPSQIRCEARAEYTDEVQEDQVRSVALCCIDHPASDLLQDFLESASNVFKHRAAVKYHGARAPTADTLRQPPSVLLFYIPLLVLLLFLLSFVFFAVQHSKLLDEYLQSFLVRLLLDVIRLFARHGSFDVVVQVRALGLFMFWLEVPEKSLESRFLCLRRGGPI
jgi:hypothetical protein